jgi:hypothetical protein
MGSFLGLFGSLAKGDQVPACWTETLPRNAARAVEDRVSKSLKYVRPVSSAQSAAL